MDFLTNLGPEIVLICFTIEYIDYTGQVQIKTRPDFQHAHQKEIDEWRVISANFGLIGIVVSLTLDLDTENKIVKTVTTDDKTIEFFTGDPAAIKAWSTNPDIEGIEVMWWPLNSARDGRVNTWNPKYDKTYSRLVCKADQSSKPKLAWGGARDDIITSTLQKIQVNLGKTAAQLARTPCGALHIFYAKAATTMLPKSVNLSSRSGAMHYQKHIDDWTVNDIEVCIKLNPNWSNFPAVIKTTVETTENYIRERKRNPVNVAMEWRLSRGCRSSIISPAYTDDENAWFIWIEVLGSASTENWWNDFALQMREAWYKLDHTAKPHWCKWWDHPDTPGEWRKQIKTVYKTELQIFKDGINNFDKSPNHVFRSAFWDSMLS